MTDSNLNNLVVFDKTFRKAMSELLAYNFNLFNEASGGSITLGAGDFEGDFALSSFWNNFAAIQFRNPYLDNSLSEITPSMLRDAAVKSAWSAGPFRFDQAQFDWLLLNPQEAAGQWAVQHAEKLTEFFIKAAITSVIAALKNDAATNIKDVTGATTKTCTQVALRQTAGLLGDQQSAIKAWIIHSIPMGDLWDAGLAANTSYLFDYGNVAITSDPFGRRFIMTDLSDLVVDDTTDYYYTLGLLPGAVGVNRGSRTNENWDTRNGRTNITTTYQLEGDFNLAVKGYAWDTTHGGKVPNLSALGVETNWDKNVTSHKHLPGVMLKCNAAA
jgi:hypothetical protein